MRGRWGSKWRGAPATQGGFRCGSAASGFRRFVDAATRGEVDALLVADRRCLTHSSMQMAGLKALAEGCGLQVYSPLTGLMELI